MDSLTGPLPASIVNSDRNRVRGSAKECRLAGQSERTRAWGRLGTIGPRRRVQHGQLRRGGLLCAKSTKSNVRCWSSIWRKCASSLKNRVNMWAKRSAEADDSNPADDERVMLTELRVPRSAARALITLCSKHICVLSATHRQPNVLP